MFNRGEKTPSSGIDNLQSENTILENDYTEENIAGGKVSNGGEEVL